MEHIGGTLKKLLKEEELEKEIRRNNHLNIYACNNSN